MDQKKSPKWRLLALGVVFSCVLVGYGFRLSQLQIVNGAEYLARQQSGDVKVQTVHAARGEIVDRNGSPLAHNEVSYSVVLDKALMPVGGENETILALTALLRGQGAAWRDSLPLLRSASGALSFPAGRDADVAALKKMFDINDYATADDVYYWLVNRYKLADYGPEDTMTIAGVRYEMERAGYSLETRYTFAEEISPETMVLVAQARGDLPGVDIEETARRVYIDGSLAPHIVGRMSAITSEELRDYLDKGYPMDARVGRDGIERAYEEQLRGRDGERLIYRDNNYNIIGVEESTPAVPGNTIVLTIDKEMQRTAYEALEEEIRLLNATAPAGQGREADAGAVAVIDIKNAEVLAAVSYPTYDLNTFAEDLERYSADPLMPYWNRALLGVYAPGSTFKPTVAVAGLTEGVITPSSIVTCRRVYTYFRDYQPTCLSYHGNMTVIDALRASCNIFFYDTGRRLGIATINAYAQALGLGVATGVELPEALGTQNDPDTANPGDVLQAAIGQLNNGYTPLQLANYVSTIARRGVRKKLSLVKSVSSYYDYSDVIETPADGEVLSVLEAPDEVWDTVFQGMINATHAVNGTSYRYLGDYPVTIASKTGTPQTREFPNSTFICFAPAEDPQIAIAVVIEKGWHGYTGAPVARKIFDQYFFPEKVAAARAAAEEAAAARAAEEEANAESAPAEAQEERPAPAETEPPQE